MPSIVFFSGVLWCVYSDEGNTRRPNETCNRSAARALLLDVRTWLGGDLATILEIMDVVELHFVFKTRYGETLRICKSILPT